MSFAILRKNCTEVAHFSYFRYRISFYDPKSGDTAVTQRDKFAVKSFPKIGEAPKGTVLVPNFLKYVQLVQKFETVPHSPHCSTTFLKKGKKKSVLCYPNSSIRIYCWCKFWKEMIKLQSLSMLLDVSKTPNTMRCVLQFKVALRSVKEWQCVHLQWSSVLGKKHFL
jgi:hypothetical protein